ncbi:MAG: hypothetical protein K0S68_316 [Candidatus Saccharibacteria bacterium]|nr:hypothetical protein [Candidatus Saccharibacteria bacterium]
MLSNGAPEGGLTHTQVRFFQDSGYFRLPGLLSPREIEQYKAFVLGEKRREDAERQAAGSGPVVKLYGLYDRNRGLMDRLIINPKLVATLWSLLGPNVVFVTNRHNHATVNDAEGTKDEARLHRDILQPTRGLITAAVYLEDSTPENGCTRIVPGSHTLPYVGVPQLNGGGTWMDEHDEFAGLLEQALPVAMPAGSVLLFTGLAFHGVGLNLSGKTRISMTLGFRAADELDAIPDDSRQVMVTGSQLYRGNDR